MTVLVLAALAGVIVFYSDHGCPCAVCYRARYRRNRHYCHTKRGGFWK